MPVHRWQNLLCGLGLAVIICIGSVPTSAQVRELLQELVRPPPPPKRNPCRHRNIKSACRSPLTNDWACRPAQIEGLVVGRPCASKCFSCVKAVSRATAGPVSGSVLSSEKTGSGERSGGTSIRSFSGTNADAIRKGILEAPDSAPRWWRPSGKCGSTRIIAFRVWSGRRNHAGPWP